MQLVVLGFLGNSSSPVRWGEIWWEVTSNCLCALGNCHSKIFLELAVLAVGALKCLFLCLWLECDRNASQTPIDFLPLAAAPPYGKYDFFSIVLHSPSRDLVHRRKNFAGGHDGVPLELMAFVECGPYSGPYLRCLLTDFDKVDCSETSRRSSVHLQDGGPKPEVVFFCTYMCRGRVLSVDLDSLRRVERRSIEKSRWAIIGEVTKIDHNFVVFGPISERSIVPRPAGGTTSISKMADPNRK